MSLLSGIILTELEKQLVIMQPQIADFLLKQLHAISLELIAYVEQKLDIIPTEDSGEDNG